MEHIEGDTGKVETLSVHEVCETRGDDLPIDVTGCVTQQHTQLFPWVPSHIDVIGVEVCRNRGTRYTVDASDMIDVAVGYEGSHRREIVFGQQFTDRDRVRRGIDHQCGATLTGSDHIRIGLEVPERPRVDEECHVIACLLDDEPVSVVDAVDSPQARENVFECFAV
jgi:hypothetical protein